MKVSNITTSSAGVSDAGPDTDSMQANGYIPPRQRKLYDSAVSFEEYHYYALQTRAEEETLPPEKSNTAGFFQTIFPRKPQNSTTGTGKKSSPLPREKDVEQEQKSSRNADSVSGAARAVIDDEEWTNASRAMRTATAGACFYLITTDILGPFGVGFALGTMGWGPGIALYTVFGLMAAYSGYLIWRCFLGLDSYQFPLRNFGDVAFRIYGQTARQCFNLLQSIQILFTVGLFIISNGQCISQISRFRLCYAVCCVIWAICGFGLGQIRTLKRYGWLAHAAVWINLLVMFIAMGAMAHSPPNYAIAILGSAGSAVDPTSITPDPVTGEYPPVRHYNGLPSPKSLIGSINGLMQAVYAYGGAHLFVEFMAEMRRPRDFLKAMWGAQFFIYACYLVHGSYVYYFQGQYAYQISYQGVSRYALQTVGNMLAVLSGTIAAGLFGNIGIKVLYNNVLMDIFHAPPLNTTKGKYLWAIIVPIYWTTAFVLAAAIPDFFGLVSVVAAFAIVQFTYSVPPFLAIGYFVQKCAIRDGEGFDPATGRVIRHDHGLRRWIRGFFAGPVVMNVGNVLYMGGALATAGLGAYAGIQGMIDVFKNPQVNAFTCTSPLNLNA